MPGSERATPLLVDVKLVPSMRNVFSLAPEPNAETSELVLPWDVGEIPGAVLIRSNMLDRRVGIALMSSGPMRVPNPGFRASIREPAPSTTTDAARPASCRTGVVSMVVPAPMRTSSVIAGEPFQLDVNHVRARRQGRETQLPFVVGGDGCRPADQRRRADANGGARKDGALGILDRSDEGSRQPLRGGDS